jgi:hypothetical protein
MRVLMFAGRIAVFERNLRNLCNRRIFHLLYFTLITPLLWISGVRYDAPDGRG